MIQCHHAVMMKAQIQFSRAQSEALRQLSAESGRSIADLVCQAVNLHLSTQQYTGRTKRVQRALRPAPQVPSLQPLDAVLG